MNYVLVDRSKGGRNQNCVILCMCGLYEFNVLPFVKLNRDGIEKRKLHCQKALANMMQVLYLPLMHLRDIHVLHVSGATV